VAREPEYRFEWDPAKARSNLTTHGVGFELAATVFLDRLAISVFDRAHSDTEDRWITIGESIDGSVIVVVHTFTELGPGRYHIRLLSARRATRRERSAYEDGQ